MIIAFSGKIHSGKDTAARIVQYLTASYHGELVRDHETFEQYISNIGYQEEWEVKRFAGKLKQIISILTGIPVEDLEKEEIKNSFLPEEWSRWYISINGERHNVVYASKEQAEPDYKIFRAIDGKIELLEERLTVRKLLQLLGTEAMRDVIHPNVHINALFSDYKATSNTIVKGEFWEGEVGNSRILNLELSTNSSEYWNKYRGREKNVNHFTTSGIYPKWLITDLRFPNENTACGIRKATRIRINRPIKHRFPELWNTLMSNEKELTEYVFLQKLKEYDIEFYKKLTHYSETALDDCKDLEYDVDNDGTLEDLVNKIKEILKEIKVI